MPSAQDRYIRGAQKQNANNLALQRQFFDFGPDLAGQVATPRRGGLAGQVLTPSQGQPTAAQQAASGGAAKKFLKQMKAMDAAKAAVQAQGGAPEEQPPGPSGPSGDAPYDPAADYARIEGLYTAGKQAIAEANTQLLARFAALRMQQERDLSNAGDTFKSDLAEIQNLYAQHAPLDATAQTRLADQANRQGAFSSQLGSVAQRSFADRESAAALINTGSLGHLESERMGAYRDVAEGARGRSSSSRDDASAQLAVSDANAVANAQGTDEMNALIQSYSGPSQRGIARLGVDLQGNPANVGIAYQKFINRKKAKTGLSRSKIHGIKRIEKNVIDPIRKIAQQQAKSTTYLKARNLIG